MNSGNAVALGARALSYNARYIDLRSLWFQNKATLIYILLCATTFSSTMFDKKVSYPTWVTETRGEYLLARAQTCLA